MWNRIRHLLALAMGAEIGMPPANEIWYQSTDGAIVSPQNNDFNVTLTENVIEDGIGKMRFDGAVTSVGYMTLYYRSNLAAIYLPEGLTYVGSQALAACDNLYKVVFPSTVTFMGANVLSSSAIRTIECRAVTPPVLSGDLADQYGHLYVPVGSADAYKAAAYWSKLANYTYEKEF